MRGNAAAISIPLTLLQVTFHSHAGVSVDPYTVLNNVLLCEAVYAADRIEAPWYSGEYALSRTCAAAATLFYASNPETLALAPLVPALHLGYGACKPYIAPCKPFFVASLWTAAICGVPAWRAHAAVPLVPAAGFLLSIAALSHAMDVVDTEEDAAAGLRTPAVVMAPDAARAYALTLGMAAAWLHASSYAPFPLYDVTCLAVTAGIVYDAPAVSAVVVAAFVAAFVNTHALEILENLLLSSDVTHHLALQVVTKALRAAAELPEPLRGVAVQGVVQVTNAGDAFGSHLLHAYEHLIGIAK